jgi:predicted DNA-binding protein (MmcQ/YjbR family)
MAHPRTYSEDDPYLAELRERCFSFPDVVEIEAWGRPTFRAGAKGKMFALFEHDDHHPYTLVFKPEPEERPALLDDRRFFIPRYHGPYGWLALDFTATKRVDWGEVDELLESSYRQVALQRMIKALDERLS